MPHSQAALGKLDFLIDIVQLLFGSKTALIVIGVVIALFVIVYIIGKVLNNQEARDDAARESQIEAGKINLNKSE